MAEYGVPQMLDHLDRVSMAIREAGDVHQVLLSDDGVSQTLSIADELYLIAVSLRAALDIPRISPGQTP